MSSEALLTGTRREVHAVILSILPSLAPEDIDESVHLKALGADSVDRVEIIMGVLERLGIQEPMSTFSDVPNIGALIELLTRLQARTK
jgi:polyketide biosynthesis acyl carrier protein